MGKIGEVGEFTEERELEGKIMGGSRRCDWEELEEEIVGGSGRCDEEELKEELQMRGSCCGAGRRRWRREGGGGSGDDNDDILVAGARSGGGRGSGDSGWTPSLAFREQPLEMKETLFFSQMTARVCGGGVPSLLTEPKMGREGKGPT